MGFVRPKSLLSVLPTPPVLITSMRAWWPPSPVKHYRLVPIASFSGADRVGGARPVPAPLLHTNTDASGLLHGAVVLQALPPRLVNREPGQNGILRRYCIGL